MKKMALISGMVVVLLLFFSNGLYAQRSYRDDPGIEEDYYGLNLTQEQKEKIDKLELELEKELSPLISRLRSSYADLDELEAQRSPDPTNIAKIWDIINTLEEDLRNREISHEDKIRDLLTNDQKGVFDSYYGYGPVPYDRGYLGRGIRGFRGGNYGYGRNRYGAGMGRNYLGRGAGRLGRGYYGYGRGTLRSSGMNRGNFRPGAGRMSGPYDYRVNPRYRYGRGPCGAGLGRWSRTGYGRGRWN
ncbi:MAG: Spy/CpxP family protein refolding chaperone [Candidatus Aminicenantaceae bacterium]